MKFKKNILIYLSILSILVTFVTYTPIVYADVPASQKAVKHSGATWSYPFDYRLHNAYFTIDNTSNIIPTSTTNSPIYFYTDDNETFYSLNGKDVYTTVLNRGIGLATSAQLLQILMNDFFNTAAYTGENNTYAQGALYDQNNLFLGYCLNDISDCYYVDLQSSNKPAVTVPKEFNNDVYNHYNYYKDNNKRYPQFITFYPPSTEFTLSHLPSITDPDNPNAENDVKSNLSNLLNQNQYLYCCQLVKGSNNVDFSNIRYDKVPTIYGKATPLNNYHFIRYGATNNWSSFCETYELIGDNNTLLFSDIWEKGYSFDSACRFEVYVYDDFTNERIRNFTDYYLLDLETTTTTSSIYIGYYYNNQFCMIGGNNPYTVFYDETTYNQVKNKTYRPDTFYSNDYKNYNVNDTQTYTITTNNIDNSQNLNQLIYDESVTNLNQNISSDNTVNTENVTNNTTTIINNYYPDQNSENPDNPDNPSDPDNPIEDDTILDAILAALKRFFDAIGKILGTILAGLLEVIDSVLESIAGIMENLGGVTEFIGSLFSWIPVPVPQILAAGISICILAAIFKFIRG